MPYTKPLMTAAVCLIVAGCTSTATSASPTQSATATATSPETRPDTQDAATPPPSPSEVASDHPTGGATGQVPNSQDRGQGDDVTEALVEALSSTGGWVLDTAVLDGEPWPPTDGLLRPDQFTLSLIRQDAASFGDVERGTAEGDGVVVGLGIGTSCNGGASGISGDVDELSVGLGYSTAMGCADDLMDGQDRFGQALDAVTAVESAPTGIALVGPGARLAFRPGPLPAWAGRTFLVDRVRDVGGPGPHPATPAQDASLRLHRDGTVTGSTGCRPITGRWSQAALWIDDPGTVPEDCPDDRREQHMSWPPC